MLGQGDGCPSSRLPRSRGLAHPPKPLLVCFSWSDSWQALGQGLRWAVFSPTVLFPLGAAARCGLQSYRNLEGQITTSTPLVMRLSGGEGLEKKGRLPVSYVILA